VREFVLSQTELFPQPPDVLANDHAQIHARVRSASVAGGIDYE
jgi:hypothetical protein